MIVILFRERVKPHLPHHQIKYVKYNKSKRGLISNV